MTRFLCVLCVLWGLAPAQIKFNSGVRLGSSVRIMQVSNQQASPVFIQAAQGTATQVTGYATPALIQFKSCSVTSASQIDCAFASNVTAGNLSAVAITWSGTASISAISDTRGNYYLPASASPIRYGSQNLSQNFYRSRAIPATGANTVIITFSATVTAADMQIAEVSNLDLNPSAYDASSYGSGTASASPATVSTAALVSSVPTEILLLAGGTTQSYASDQSGTGFTKAQITPAGDLLAYKVVTSAGSQTGQAKVNASDWILQMMALKAKPTTVQAPGAQAVFGQANSAGNLLVAMVGWQDGTHDITGVTDDAGNTYTKIGATASYTSGGVTLRQAIYYAKNIVAAAAGNKVTAAFDGDNTPTVPDIRILEYSGLDKTSPVDTITSASGSVTSPGGRVLVGTPQQAVATASELIVSGTLVTYGIDSVPASVPLTELRLLGSDRSYAASDRITTAVANYGSQVYLQAASQLWLMQSAYLKGAGQIGEVPSPQLYSVTPGNGPTGGGTAVVLAGADFRQGARVKFGGAAATDVIVGSDVFSPTTTYTAEVANNTAACSGTPLPSYCNAAFAGQNTDPAHIGAETSLPNPAPGNVSQLDIHRLLPAGTKVLAHFMGWFTKAGTGDHNDTHYDSNDAATVKAQMDDMVRRHLDGPAIDWYSQFNSTTDGTTQKVSSDLAARCSSPQNCPLEYVLVEDQGAVTRQQGARAACAIGDATCLQASILQDLCYANATYFGTDAYLKVNSTTHAWQTSTNPLVGFFPPSNATAWNTAVSNVKTLTASNGWAAANCPSGQQQANGGLIFFNSSTTDVTQAPYHGGSSWVSPSAWSVTNQFLIDGGTGSYHETLYASCNANPSKFCIGSAKKGFDDSLASWGSDRVVAQECGQTWVSTLAKASNFSGANLTFQIPTWNDYEEGTAIEAGIDNCYTLSASVSGSTLNWTVNTSDSAYAPTSGALNGTVDHFEVLYGNSSGLAIAGDNLSPSSRSFDLGTLPAGSWSVYVKAVGKPSILNQTSAGVAYTSTAAGQRISATTPAHVAGQVDVQVINPDGFQGTLSNGFRYDSTPTRILTLTLMGTGSGRVTSSPAGMDCTSGTCQAGFPQGTVVTLTATANSGSAFDPGWNGPCTGTGGCVITMDADTAVTATFSLSSRTYTTNFPLTENPISEGGNWSLNNFTAGWPGSTHVRTNGTMAYGTQNGSGATDDSAATLTGTWNADQEASGTVWHNSSSNSNEAEIHLRSNIAAAVNPTPRLYEIYWRMSNATYSYLNFARWNGDGTWTALCSNNGTNFGVNSGDVLRATVSGQNPVVLTAYINGVQKATCSDSSASRILAGNPGMGFYVNSGGNPANAGFTSFTALDHGAAPPQQAQLTVGKSGSGTVSGEPPNDQIQCGSTCAYSYPLGTTVTLDATPGSGYILDSWGGACAGNGQCVVTLNSDTTVQANFLTASSVNYYVDLSAGSDSAAGTSWTTAWRTLAHAASAGSVGSSGTTVHIRGTLNSSLGNTSGAIAKSGLSASRRWVWQCEGCHLIGNGAAGWTAYQWKGDWIDVVGFDVTTTATGSSDVSDSSLFDGRGNYIRFRNNYIHDSANGCHLYVGAGGISTESGTGTQNWHDWEISGNTIKNLWNNFHSTSGYPTESDNICHGLYLRVDHLSVYNNIIYDVNHGRAMTLAASGGTSGQTHGYFSVSNNLVYNDGATTGNGGGILACNGRINSGTDGYPPNYVTADNNLIYGNQGGFSIMTSACSTFRAANNLISGNRSNAVSGSGCTVPAGAVSGTVTSTPTFKDFAGRDFHAASSVSPQVNAGTSSVCVSGGDTPCIPASDKDGVSRPRGAAIDIGPYEWPE